jgi:hypothetical protein
LLTAAHNPGSKSHHGAYLNMLSIEALVAQGVSHTDGGFTATSFKHLFRTVLV